MIILPPMMESLPNLPIYDFSDAPPGTPEELNELLGGKGANLVVMARDLGLPVPPGFVITTAVCRSFLAGAWPEELDAELHAAMDRLGERVGRRFGDPNDPLLVSVRSGAPVSMPGMMDTVLNLGLTSRTLPGLAGVAGAAFAEDCRRRLAEGWESVLGSTSVPDDPWQQLHAAIEAVFKSWNSDRARAYRAREGISDDLGTAVVVQAMVFGNRGADSGTGVLFTRNPSTGENELYGDVMFNAQGEDVVAGTHATAPISDLASRLPAVDAQLREVAGRLERHYRDLCDIEFTIEEGRLWMLQVRIGKRSPRAALRMAIEMAEDPAFPLTRDEAVERIAPLLADPPRSFVRTSDPGAPITSGLPASPGVASGAVVTSSEEAIAAADRRESVILVRSETSPEDVAGMARAAGVLTARGGLASHAAVVARGWGIPAVVGAGEAVLGLAAGDRISIDGSTGEVFRGELAGEWQVAPEAGVLLSWASEPGVRVGRLNTSSPTVEEAITPVESVSVITADDVVRALAIKGAATVEQLVESIGTEMAQLEPLIEQLAASAFVETASGQLRLTAAGKLEAADLFAADRAALGRCEERLEEFHAFDGRMKEVVTAWQVRDVAGEQVLNDHADATYDAAVLDDLGRLHEDTAAWLASVSSIRRFVVYRARLERALGLCRGGDQRFVASPRVDSYHSVWFELHEDLIRLAGKKRSDVTTG
jgi:pyruvate,orthophosphate dikinase